MLNLATLLAQPIIAGLLYGATYALAALGLSLIFSVLGVLNLAHGDFVMLGGFVGFYVAGTISVAQYGLAAVLGILLVSFILIALLGAVYELIFVRYILKRSGTDVLISSILVTIGTAFIIENVGYQYMPLFIPFRQSIFRIVAPVKQLTFNYGGVFIQGVQVISLITLAVATVLLYFFSRRTYLGKAMRAITQNKESTLLMGVNLQRVSVMTFAMGSGFGALAGVTIAMTSTMSPGFGIAYTISLLSVMVLGGTKSYWGPLVGGLIIGVLQTMIQSQIVNSIYIPVLNISFNGIYYWAPVISILVLIVVLLIRPTGLAGSRQ